MLRFDAEQHRYFLGDRELPSVTAVLSVLDQYENVPRAALNAAREFGQHVHMACDLDNRGVLDEATLDPALAPYLAGWRKYRENTGLEIIASEMRLHHESYRYAGTADVFGRLKGRPAVIDIKSGLVPKTVGAQTAAYAECIQHAERESRRLDRYCVQLMPGNYRVHRLTETADWHLFLSCLNITAWRMKNAR